MGSIQLKGTLFSIISCISLTACSISPSSTATTTTLEKITNIEATPSTKVNTAQLIKQPQNCLIEFKGQFEGGQAVEHWIFNQQGLIAAQSTTTEYADRAQAASRKQTSFDIQNPETQENFKKLKSNFNEQKLAKCM